MPFLAARRGILAATIVVAGCQDVTDASQEVPEGPVASGESRRLDELSESIDSLHADIRRLEVDTLVLKSARDSYKKAVFDPVGDGGFQRVDTTAGMFLVSLEDIKEYGDGSRVTFEIGNIGAATYVNSKLTVSWGPKPPEMPSFGDSEERWDEYTKADSETQKLRQSKTVTVTRPLRSGVWNRYSVNLPGVPPKNLGPVETSLTISTVQLTSERK